MQEIPLFPLNLVLFPGMSINLHIFEPRYLSMVSACLDQDSPFGVVLIKKGHEALGPLAEPYPVGTTASITATQKLTQKRLNITVAGGEIFEIVHLDPSGEYLMGQVDERDYPREDPDAILDASDRLRPWVEKYINMLSEAKLASAESFRLPEEPLELAYLSAHLLQISPKHKQALLEKDSATAFIDQTRRYFKREISLLRSLLEDPKPGEGLAGRLN